MKKLQGGPVNKNVLNKFCFSRQPNVCVNPS